MKTLIGRFLYCYCLILNLHTCTDVQDSVYRVPACGAKGNLRFIHSTTTFNYFPFSILVHGDNLFTLHYTLNIYFDSNVQAICKQWRHSRSSLVLVPLYLNIDIHIFEEDVHAFMGWTCSHGCVGLGGIQWLNGSAPDCQPGLTQEAYHLRCGSQASLRVCCPVRNKYMQYSKIPRERKKIVILDRLGLWIRCKLRNH